MRTTLIALSCCVLASAKTLITTLGKRDETDIVSPYSWPPSQYWEGNDGRWSTFALQVGSPPQVVRVLPSTASTNIWVVQPLGCPSFYPSTCPADRGNLFKSNESTTYIANGNYNLGVEENLGYSIAATYGFDMATLAWAGSGGPTVNRSVIAAQINTTFFLGSFGLNPAPTNYTNLNNSTESFMTVLKANKEIPSISYGYTAGARYQMSGVYGSLVLGGYDAARFAANNITFAMNVDVARELVVKVNSLTIDTASLGSYGYSDAFYAVIDSTIPWLVLPQRFCAQFEKTFNLTWSRDLSLYLLNATQHANLLRANPSITVTLGESADTSVSITLPYSAFDLNVSYPILDDSGSTSYYFPLKRGDNDTQYTLGRAFLQEAYLTVDYERRNFSVSACVWNSGTTSQQIKTILDPATVTAIQDADAASKRKTQTGAIAGGVVGALAIIALFLAFFFIRRRRRRQRERDTAARLEEERLNAMSKPKISEPMGGELSGDTAVHEMDHYGPTKKFALPELDNGPGMHHHPDAKAEMEGDGAFGADKKMAGSGAHEMEGSYPVYELDAGQKHVPPQRGAGIDQSGRSGS